jgi:hypothetical protein
MRQFFPPLCIASSVCAASTDSIVRHITVLLSIYLSLAVFLILLFAQVPALLSEIFRCWYPSG